MGRKISRKDKNLEYSIIEEGNVNDGTLKRYTLFAGKKRPGVQATHKGKGEFGSVKLAQNDNGDVLAVKIFKLKEDKKEQETQLKDISAEVSNLKKLGYPADLVITNNKAYFFQPYFKGKSIKDVFVENVEKLDNRDLADDLNTQGIQILNNMNVVIQHMDYTISFLRAVKELHQKGALHCDLHSENVLYDKTTHKTYLIDYGLSQFLNPGDDKIISKGTHPTYSGHLPKEARGLDDGNHIYSKSSDLYALGYNAFYVCDFMEKIKPLPWTNEFDKIIEEIDTFILHFVTNYEATESHKNKDVQTAMNIINNRKSIDAIIEFLDVKTKQLIKNRKEFEVSPGELSKNLLKKTTPVERMKLIKEVTHRKLLFSQIKLQSAGAQPILKPLAKGRPSIVTNKLMFSQLKATMKAALRNNKPFLRSMENTRIPSPKEKLDDEQSSKNSSGVSPAASPTASPVSLSPKLSATPESSAILTPRFKPHTPSGNKRS